MTLRLLSFHPRLPPAHRQSVATRTFPTIVPSRPLLSFPRHHHKNLMAGTDLPPPDRRPVVISGPSGVGKGTLYNLLFDRHPGVFAPSVSHTTRSPRPGEEDGRHYHFVSEEEFLALAERDGFVEHAQFGGNRYGTSKATIQEQSARDRVVVLDIEMEGVRQIKAAGALPARFVFIAPPAPEEEVLERRLRRRGTEKEASILERLAKAREELEFAKTPGVHDKIIVNDDLEMAYEELERFVYGPAEGVI